MPDQVPYTQRNAETTLSGGAGAAARAGRLPIGLPAIGAAATVALLALSQVLAVGALSAMPLGVDALRIGVVAGFVTATVGGFIVAVMARAPGEIFGPASSVGVIYAALCADLISRGGPQVNVGDVWAALSLAVALMGVLLALAGWLRLAEAVKFMPAPVSAGFVTGIGLLVIWSQAGPLLGLEGRISSYRWPDVLGQVKPASLIVGAATMFSMWAYPKIATRGQPPLAALLVGTATYYLVAWVYGTHELGPTLGTIAPVAIAESNFHTVWGSINPSWLVATGLYVLPYAAFLALQAVMNAAVTSAAVSGIVGARSDVNRTLKAQGLANVLCGALGALPLTTAASLSLPAARMKGATAIVPAASCVILFAALLGAARVLAYIPVAVLAGILVMIGAGMIDRWARSLATRAWPRTGNDSHLTWNLVLVAAVAAAFFVGGVPVALLVGALLAMVLLAVDLSLATTFGRQAAGELASTRVWPSEQARWLASARDTIAIFRPRGGLFFGTAEQLATRLAALRPGTRYCVLDVSRLTMLDATGCQIVAASARKLAAGGITTVLAGVDPARPREQALIALGLGHPDPRQHWFTDLDHALEWVESELLKENWPQLVIDAPVDIADSPLAEGLSPPQLEQLRSCFVPVDVEAGPLFKRGDAGASMFIIDSGLVEVWLHDEETERSTRLAVFGPGSIFGEIVMLTSDERMADAVCVKRTRLYELKREKLAELEQRAPALYMRVISNLNVHLANRLIMTTGTVQVHR